MQSIKPLNLGIWLCLMSAWIGLYGCISDPKMVELDDTLRAYDRAVRWGNYQMIPSFRNKEKAGEQLDYDRLKSIRVTGYAPKHMRVSDKGMDAEQIVEIRYYDENVAREKVEMDRQQWSYDDDLNRWVLVSDLPKFIYP
ncbi:MAG: hypothetical protein AMJ53_11745 [Gammaproteobacteria bacterium SG8_11]|nr:MAG: hypothetical protein AMJ53_11745 [Gammaproteobacteria bacterium SG8_11]